MTNVLNTIIELKYHIYQDFLPKLYMLELELKEPVIDNSSLKLLANVACQTINENKLNNQCNARMRNGTRCKGKVKGNDKFNLDSMYCNNHCLNYERETRQKPKNTLVYGDFLYNDDTV